MKTVIGMDLGDKSHFVVVIDGKGEEVRKTSLPNSARRLERFFGSYKGTVVVMEAGTHSPWVSRLLESMGLEVCIANPRKVRTIWDANDKSDERDARTLAHLYRAEPRLLHPIRHRGEQAQADLQIIKSRAALIGARTELINHVRCAVKATGTRIPKCSAASFHKKAPEFLPASLAPVLGILVESIATMTGQIKEIDKRIEALCEERYPETELLMAIGGVGPLTALAFVLTIEEPARFTKSRKVGAYLGLTPKRDQSGECDKQLRITKAGNSYLRQLLVSCAHYILGPFGPDCDLRRHGERIAQVGGKSAKKRAVVAVARKLAVLMHRLWRIGAVYQPFMNKQTA